MPENTTETAEVTEPVEEVAEDQLLQLPPEKLAGMLREKRKAEASVRSKLREAETERDRYAGAVTGYQRQAFAQAAEGHRMQESALDDVLAAVSLEEMLAEDGTVDAGKVGPALAELQKSKPHYFRSSPGRSAAEFSGGSGEPGPSASWSDVLH